VGRSQTRAEEQDDLWVPQFAVIVGTMLA
jgi:hypothetical protein